MNVELTIVIIILAIVIWFSRSSPSKGMAADKVKDTPPKTTSIDGASIVESDPFLDDIIRARQKATLQVESVTLESERVCQAEFARDTELKERLSRFAREQELDKAIIALWKEIEYYPEWAKREDFSKFNLLQITDIDSSQAGDTRTIFFSHGSHRYALSRKTWLGMVDNNAYEDFGLQEDGVEVFAITSSPKYDGYTTTYSSLGITAFKKQGHWANLLLEMFCRIQIHRNKSSFESKRSRAAEIREHFQE